MLEKLLFDHVHQYNINSNKWSKLQSKMPKKLEFIVSTSVLNGQFVLIFGGSECDGTRQDDIYIYSVNDESFKLSNVKCPESGHYQAMSIKDKQKDNVTTFGFIRSEWSKCMMSDHLFPPQYLIQIICGYYAEEFVHLFNIHSSKHYKMDVFYIINC